MTATPTSGDWGSQKQRMLAGDPCIADDPGIAADWLRFALLVQEYNGSSPADPVRRTALLRKPFGPDDPQGVATLRPGTVRGTVVLARGPGGGHRRNRCVWRVAGGPSRGQCSTWPACCCGGV